MNANWVDTEPKLAGFTVSDDPLYAAGVRVAAGDFDGDHKADVVTAPGRGVAPQISVSTARRRPDRVVPGRRRRPIRADGSSQRAI